MVNLLQDPRTKDWFLIGSPWGVLTLLGFYLYFVQVLGPRLMERRKPYELDRIIQIYNVIQILLNAYLLRVVNRIVFKYQENKILWKVTLKLKHIIL